MPTRFYIVENKSYEQKQIRIERKNKNVLGNVHHHTHPKVRDTVNVRTPSRGTCFDLGIFFLNLTLNRSRSVFQHIAH